MNLAHFIDHTILTPDCTLADIERLCLEAKQYGFTAVCVPPYYIQAAAKHLEDQPVKISTVIGFPMGYSATPAKVEEIKRAIDEGAREVDVVVNVCAIKSGNWNYVRNDIDSMTTSVHLKGKMIKIIFEVSLLSKEEIIQLCDICNKIEVNFVKTSTGFNGGGATVTAVELLRQHLDKSIKIKASGGIRTREDAMRLLDAGAERIGTSAGVFIMNDL